MARLKCKAKVHVGLPWGQMEVNSDVSVQLFRAVRKIHIKKEKKKKKNFIYIKVQKNIKA